MDSIHRQQHQQQQQPQQQPSQAAATAAAEHVRSFQHWDDANWHQVHLARHEAHAADQVLAQADLAVRQAAQVRLKAEVNSDRQLEMRVQRLIYWKREIESALAECTQQEECLVAELDRVSRALGHLDHPLAVNRQCAQRRNERQHEDLVQDDVDRRLDGERAVLERSQRTLEAVRDEVEEQLRLCRKHINKLNKDLKLKEAALSTDEECLEKLKSGELDSAFRSGGAAGNNLQPAQHCQNEDQQDSKPFKETAHWEKRNSVEVERARVQVQNCVRTGSRSRHDRKCVREDVLRALTSTDQALANRCSQSAEATQILTQQLAKTREQIDRVSLKLDEVRSKISEQMPQMDKAQTRVRARVGYRPNRERCFDGAQVSLLEEVDQLRSNERSLSDIKCQMERTLNDLRARQADLDARLEVKSNSAHIDQDFCVAQRKTLHYDHFVA